MPEAKVGDGDQEPHDGARRVKLAGIARRIAHLAQHGFVERAQRVQLVAGGEMNAAELVDDIAQQVAADHPVLHALEHGGDHVAPVVAVGTRQCAQVTEETRAFLAARQRSLLIVDK